MAVGMTMSRVVFSMALSSRWPSETPDARHPRYYQHVPGCPADILIQTRSAVRSRAQKRKKASWLAAPIENVQRRLDACDSHGRKGDRSPGRGVEATEGGRQTWPRKSIRQLAKPKSAG